MLEKLLLSDQPERFRKAQAFIKAQGLSADAVAELVSSAVVQALLASTQELQPGEIWTAAVCMGVVLCSLNDTCSERYTELLSLRSFITHFMSFS